MELQQIRLRQNEQLACIQVRSATAGGSHANQQRGWSTSSRKHTCSSAGSSSPGPSCNPWHASPAGSTPTPQKIVRRVASSTAEGEMCGVRWQPASTRQAALLGSRQPKNGLAWPLRPRTRQAALLGRPAHLDDGWHQAQGGDPRSLDELAKGAAQRRALEDGDGRAVQQGCRGRSWEVRTAGSGCSARGGAAGDGSGSGKQPLKDGCSDSYPACPRCCTSKSQQCLPLGRTCVHQPRPHHPAHIGGPAQHVPGPHILVKEGVGAAAQRGGVRPRYGLGLACRKEECGAEQW